MDAKVEREAWGGKLPAMFTLAQNEVVTMNPPLPLFLLLPRMSYLHLVASKTVRNHFLPSAPAREDELWYELNGVPVKWNLPIGVISDLIVGVPSSSTSSSSSSSSSEAESVSSGELPLNFVVHFQAFPKHRLMRCKNLFVVRSMFLSRMKEACYLMCGDARAVMDLSEQEHDQIWEALSEHKFNPYREIRDKIKKVVTATQQNLKGENNNCHYPVRLYVFGFDQIVRPSSSSSPTSLGQRRVQYFSDIDAKDILASSGTLPPCNFSCIQQPLAYSADDGKLRSSSSSSSSSSSERQQQQPPPEKNNNDNEEAEEEGGDGGDVEEKGQHEASLFDALYSMLPVAGREVVLDVSKKALQPNVNVLIHGVKMPLETPVGWLCEHFAMADLYLYVCVVDTRRQKLQALDIENHGRRSRNTSYNDFDF